MVNTIARTKDYSDLDLDFIAHPVTKDVMKKTGVEAIKRSVRNLLLTNFYDRPFRSEIGSNALKILFENATPFTSVFLRNAIYETLTSFEPRIAVNDIAVDFNEDNNGYNVRLIFTILNRNQPVSVTIFLERVR